MTNKEIQELRELCGHIEIPTGPSEMVVFTRNGWVTLEEALKEKDYIQKME